MKTVEQYFVVVLLLYKVVLTVVPLEEQYFPVVLFIMLYKVILPFDFVDEILKCDHSNNCSNKSLLHTVQMIEKVVARPTYRRGGRLHSLFYYKRVLKKRN